MRGKPELGREHLQDTIEIAEYLVVPDTNDFVAKRIEIGIASPVSRAIGVLATVDFDNQVPLAADKIDVIWPYRLLPRKLQAAETAITKRQP